MDTSKNIKELNNIPSSINIVGCNTLNKVYKYTFKTEEVSRLLNVSSRQIRYWIDEQCLNSDIIVADGKGSRRIFSTKNLVEISILSSLSIAGINIKQMKEVIGYLNDEQYFDYLHRRRNNEVVFITVKDHNGVGIKKTCPDKAELMNGNKIVTLINLPEIERCVVRAIKERLQ